MCCHGENGFPSRRRVTHEPSSSCLSHATWQQVIHPIDLVVLVVFITESGLKFVALDFQPWRFFYSGWNCFDFVIVIGSLDTFGPQWQVLPLEGSQLKLLRMLRLLRVLKLIKALPQLAVIINAMIMGFASIGFIAILLFMVFYMFAIGGILLFREVVLTT